MNAAGIGRRLAMAGQKLSSLAQSASTAQKLALAFTLFLAPLVFVASELAQEQQTNVDTARREREGASYLRLVNEVHALLNMQARAQQLGRDDIDNISTAVRALRLAEKRYGEGFETVDLSDRAVLALQVMLNNPNARLTAASAASAALSDLAHQIGDRSGLIRDPARSSHFMAEIVIDRAPALAQEARDLAQDASTAIGDGRWSETERATVLQRLAVLQNLSQTLDRTMESMFGADPALEDALGAPAYNAVTNFAAYRASIERAARSGRLDVEAIVASEAGAQFALSELSSRVSAELDAALSARAEHLADKRTLTLLLACALFLGVLGLVVALLRVGIVEPIDAISHSIRAIAGGDYDADIPALKRGDEIGEMARALAILRDAAQAKIAADAARAAAESANLAKSQFVAAMSHELRTPLNAIMGYAEILAEDAEDRADASSQSDLQRINTAARHLLAVINDILDLSKIEAGRMDVLAAPCDPMALAQDVIATAAPLAAQNGNVILHDIAPLHTAFIDAQKLRQCLLNLLSNACKFTQHGEISIEMKREQVDGEARLAFIVRDTGIGISAEQMTRLFRPFEQAAPAVTRKYGGTGLGLMITRRMAELMGGQVGVASTLGEGAVFTLWIPQHFRGFDAEGVADISARHGADDAPLVVVIDDEASARDLAVRTLTPLGLAVQAARTGEAGLQLTRETRPSLVVLDIKLPDRSGWDLLAELSRDPATADIPILILSIDSDRRRSLELGAAEHLVKPATREQISAAVRRLMRPNPDQDTLAAPVRLSA